MSRVWLIARHHFLQEARKRSFLVLLFSLPLFLMVIIGAGELMRRLTEEGSARLGYVDQAGLLGDVVPGALETEDVVFVPLATEDAARAALEAGQVDGYYLLAPDFASSRQAQLVYFEMPPYKATVAFATLMRQRLLAGQEAAVVKRALEGAEVQVFATESGREYPTGAPPLGNFLPLVIAAVTGFLIMTTSGYMMEVVILEKESRTMEIVVSSVSPGKMMAGKILGALIIAALQLLVWAAFFAAALWAGRTLLQVSWLQDIQPPWEDILKMVVISVPVYLCISAFMTALGATMSDSQEAQQIGPFFLMILYIPIWVLLPMADNLNNALSLLLSFFPPTALTAVATRMLIIVVPWWQIGVTAAVALLFAGCFVWLAGRVLRLNLLRYGQPLKWRELISRRPVQAAPAPRLSTPGEFYE